ncbi:hypothetical protein HMPREF0514_11374 [Lactobacillus paragasseri JV-V03]|uniref:Uncharacterized protein n=1 Tax=Lactobacillus paragasseri JV-V03 TaxID=525326 RepID=A0AA87A8K2_9LACO|nr:hypothetical protein HMPREF0514_11374 [Lactobacillus paragasseri JV-V03]
MSPPGGKTTAAHKTFCGNNYTETVFVKEDEQDKKLAINFAGFFNEHHCLVLILFLFMV